MKRLQSINRFLCLAAASSLVGQLVLAGVCLPSPVAGAARKALVAEGSSVVGQSALAARSPAASLPADSRLSCGAAQRCDLHFMLKESERAKPSAISLSPAGRAPQVPRPGLRAPSRASDSRVLWIETCNSSLNVRHVRMQI
jgi:hypothetical protein